MIFTAKTIIPVGSFFRLNNILKYSAGDAARKRTFSLHAFAEMKPVGTMTKVVCTLGPSTDSKQMIDQRTFLIYAFSCLWIYLQFGLDLTSFYVLIPSFSIRHLLTYCT